MSTSGAAAMDMQPFFFGPDDRRLFGCLHAAASPARDCGLVCAYPRGHEYLKFHRAYRQLALLLADAGFPVLRFDWAGTGDSAGDEALWTLDGWTADLGRAVDELRRRTGCRRIGLIGMSLGASIALRAGAGGLDVDSLVLWDPVLDGARHLARLESEHRGMVRFAHVLEQAGPTEGNENLGFPLPELLRADLATLRLLKTTRKPARRVLLLDSNPRIDQEALLELLVRLVVNAEIRHFESPSLWAWTEDFGRVHVPHKVIQAIVSWLSAEYA